LPQKKERNQKSRDADATIKGFEYQFLMTQKRLLEDLKAGKTTTFVIEGVEDLDVLSTNTELQQYKYYEKTRVTNSVLQKPIAYMYCHWKKNKNKKFKYKIFIYDSQQSDIKLTSLEIADILKLTNAQKIREKNLGEEKLSENEVSIFSQSFSIEEVESFQVEETAVINLVSNALHKSLSSSKCLYLPLISQYIHSIAIRESIDDRTISLANFLSHIQKMDTEMFRNFTKCSTNDDRLINAFISQMKSIKKSNSHTYSYVLRFGRSWKDRLSADEINTIASEFACKNNRVTNKPVTFLLDFNLKDLFSLKKELLKKRNKNNCLIMNDGYESICFNKETFGLPAIFTTTKNRNRYVDVSFNYRIASSKHSIECLKELDAFIINFDFSLDESTSTYPSVHFTGFQSDFVLKLMGRLAKK
jgi:hypothetical protein